MVRAEANDRPSTVLAVLLVGAPVVGGALLFLLFDAGPIHRLGLYMLAAGVVVGGALLLMRTAP